MSVSMMRIDAIMENYFSVNGNAITFNYPDSRIAKVSFENDNTNSFPNQLKMLYPGIYNFAVDLIFDEIHPY